MANQLPILKTRGGVKRLFKKVQQLRTEPSGEEKLGLMLFFISASKVLEKELKKSLIEKVTSIFDRK